MSKEIIRFKGLSLNRDEQSAGSGELSLCAGVELHDGALRPSVLEGSTVAERLAVGDEVATLVYVHETASYRHMIGKAGNTLYWFETLPDGEGTVADGVSIHEFAADDKIISINSVGNTLMVLAESGVHGILWNEDDYKYLGDEIPFVEICFRPSDDKKGDYAEPTPDGYAASRELAINTREIYWVDGVAGDNHSYIVPNDAHPIIQIKDEHEDAVTESIWALINQANNSIAKEGRFYAPFLIRYCYRLYDGTSLVMHSAPVFMNVSLPYSYRVWESSGNLYRYWATGSHNWIWRINEANDLNTKFTYKPNNVGIRYNVNPSDGNAERFERLKYWSDIVKSIDIFVSPMMQREKSGEKIKHFVAEKETMFGVKDNRLEKYDYDNTDEDSFYADIPMYSDEEYLEKLKNCSTFFKLTSIDLEKDSIEVDESYHDLKYDKDIVANITSQELMKDDYRTHCKLFPMEANRGMYIYNHRVNLFGMYEKLFEGYSIQSMINKYNGATERYVGKIVVELHTEHGTKYVEKDCHGQPYPVRAICNSILYYPDSRAVNMTLYFCDSSGELTGQRLVMKMENHNFLNGAVTAPFFFKSDFEDAIINDGNWPPAVDDLIPMRNTVITSEVDNPYYFPVEGRNTIGVGNIIGVAAVTRALSQGQVGDHDLVVFATDGIWVMKVSSDGTYTALHNISREVCTNAKSICQLDQSVVFATERSLSRFVESNVVSMSDVLDGPMRDWSGLFGDFFKDDEAIRRQLENVTPAVELFNKGQVFYDYAGARVIVLPREETSLDSEGTAAEMPDGETSGVVVPDGETSGVVVPDGETSGVVVPDGEASGVVAGMVAMVFSIRDQAWSTMAIPAIRAVVPGYPSPFVQTDDGKVVLLDKTYDYRDAGEKVSGLVITRELTFSDTMDVIRGFRQYSDGEASPTLFLFGSNDQRKWQHIGMSARWFHNYLPGRPFRFFRVAVYMKMLPSEEYQQLQLEVVNKYAKL